MGGKEKKSPFTEGAFNLIIRNSLLLGADHSPRLKRRTVVRQ
jgi:hypothetical protein